MNGTMVYHILNNNLYQQHLKINSSQSLLVNTTLNTFLFQIVGDYYITAPTHKLAQIMSLRNTPVYIYNYEYESILAQWKGK